MANLIEDPATRNTWRKIGSLSYFLTTARNVQFQEKLETRVLTAIDQNDQYQGSMDATTICISFNP